MEGRRESRRRAGTAGDAGGSSRKKSTAGRSESQTTFSPQVLKKNVEQWLGQVEKMGAAGIYEEYLGIRGVDFPDLSHKHFDAAPNERKRYSNIACWDQSRVVLAETRGGGDFVHANYVNGPGRERKWVLCQGPMPSTAGHFWEMVWQEQIGVLVMLCLIRERDPDGAERDKCFQYWPLEEGTRLKAHGLEIINEKTWMDEPQLEGQRIKVSNLWLKKGLNRRKLVHFQYQNWADMDVPESLNAMVHFQTMVKGKQRELVHQKKVPQSAPILVHCSAGVGRSGTFVCIDNAVTSLTTTGGRAFSVRELALDLRRQRFQAIQTQRQYLYVFQTLIAHLTAKKFLPPSTQIPQPPSSAPASVGPTSTSVFLQPQSAAASAALFPAKPPAKSSRKT